MLGGGGFGSNQNQQSSGGMFGASTSFGVGIGQQGLSQNINSMQQPSAGLFNSSTSLFGGNASPGLFGNAGSSNSGFGSTGQTSVFGQSSNGLFGQSMGAFGGNPQMSSSQPSIFGSSSSSGVGSNSGFFNSSSTNNSGGFGSFQNTFGTTVGFGGQSSQSNPTNYFGQQNSGGIFGSVPVQNFGNTSISPFGGTMGTNTNIFGTKKGTQGITFQPIVDRDSDARIMSIVYQKDIDQKKSVEELRWEDYQEKRGPTSSLSTLSTNFSSNTTNTFGGSSFASGSGGFNSSSQGSSVSSSIFGQPQTSFLASSTAQNSLLISNASSTGLGQTSLLNQGIQNSQPGISNSQFTSGNNGLFGTSNNSSSFSLQSSTNSSNTGLFSTPTLFSGSNNNNSINNNNLGGNTGSLNNGSLFGQPSNMGSLDSTFKTSGSLFGGAPATSTNTGLGLFNSNSNTQPHISLSSSSLGMKPLFGNNQTLSSSNLGGSNTSGTNLPLSTNLFGSTLPSSSGLFSMSGSSSLFGSTQSQNTLNNSNPGTSSSSLFGQSPSLSQTYGLTGNNSSNPSWQSLNTSAPNSLTGQTNLTGSSQANSSIQLQNILGGQLNKSAPSQSSSLVISNGLSTSNKLSNSILSKPISQNSKYSDSADRGKSLWLWKPLPQFISRSNRYHLDGLSQVSHEGGTNSSELALPALAAESARHSTALLTSVRRIEKTIDPQTPAAFLSLLERQQQFFDAIQSPEQNSNSPINSKARSLVFSTSHATKFVPIDEAFEDAIDDSNLVAFSPRVSKTENRSVIDGTKSLINLDSISRISKDVQISKKENSRNSIGRASIESNNTTRTPYLNQHRSSVNSISAVSNERPARTSIGLTTPRPITRRTDQIMDNISSDMSKSYQRKQEYIIESLAPILTKSDYFCIPSIEVLKTFSEERLATVEDFKIVREGVGEIIWPGITDLRGINLDLVVSIEPLCVSVYGDGDSSIPIGEGLNKKAIVTLKNCKPKRTIPSKDQQEIDEFNNNRVKQIKSYTEQMGARFISLDVATWEWKFEVAHFSKYGLPNEDCDLATIKRPCSVLEIKKEKSPEDSHKNNVLHSHFKSEQSINHFFVRMSQYSFNLYSEIKSMLENNKSLKKRAYDELSFRSGMYIGSNSFVILPHRSSSRNNQKYSGYNTSITIFRLDRKKESIQTNTRNVLYRRRLISAWFRSYLRIIGDQIIQDNNEITKESLIKLVFLLWSITRKEIRISSHLSEFNLKSSNFECLKYFERSFSLICGMLELVNNSDNLSENHLESSLREFISWWIRPTLRNNSEIKFKKNNESSLGLAEEKLHFLLNNIMSGNIFEIAASDKEIPSLIPRMTSLLLSIGNNNNSILYIRENLQWWSKINICSELTNNSNKLYKIISNADVLINDHSCECQTSIYLSANYSTNPKLCDKLHRMKNVPTIDKTCKLDELIKSNEPVNMSKFEASKNQILFDDIQLQIIKFFFCNGESRHAELIRLNNSESSQLPSSFIWLVARLLTIYHNIGSNIDQFPFPNKLNLMLIEELEALGMWEWAVYIVMHTKMNVYYLNLVNYIIMKNIQENPEYLNPEDYLSDRKWEFLVNKVGVPSNWLFEAIIYKFESNWNVFQSLKFTMYLINNLKHKGEYDIGDLFFQKPDYTSVIKSLTISATEKLFHISVLPTTLTEMSTVLKHVITERKTFGSKYCDIYQIDTTDILMEIFCSINEGQVENSLWQYLKLIVTISNQYMKFAVKLTESESFSINKYELENMISNIDRFTALREDFNKCSFEQHIKDIMNYECWDIILSTIRIANHVGRV